MRKTPTCILLALLLKAVFAGAGMIAAPEPADRNEFMHPPGALRRVAERDDKTPPEDRVRLDKLRGRNVEPTGGDAFGTRGWQKPVVPKVPATTVPPVVSAPPPPPSVAPPPNAPPLPFVFLGRVSSEEVEAVFLALGERNLVVRKGEIVESIYRIDAISEMRLTLTHLPTGIQQQLSFGDAR